MKSKKLLRVEKEEIVEQKHLQDVFNFARMKEELEIKIISNSPQTLEMQIKGIDASIANGLRRIIIAEIPTMAFHKVLMYQNTSVLPDELLVHRLGLLPLQVDPNEFQSRQDNQEVNADNSLKFQLKVSCKRKKEFENHTDEDLQQLKPEQYLQNCNVYSNLLRWVPQGNQGSRLHSIKLVHENILIAKLRENQQIYLEIFAEKGIGKKHAKWSPVSTCFYRLMPDISLSNQFNHQKHADDLIGCCPAQVFSKKKGKAVVSKPRDCTTCRECIKLEGVNVSKVKDHFIFTIESIGIFGASDIFLRALRVLQQKSKSYII